MSDLVERARLIVAGDCYGVVEDACRVGCECRDRAVQVIGLASATAADRIEALEAENARLLEALDVAHYYIDASDIELREAGRELLPRTPAEEQRR